MTQGNIPSALVQSLQALLQHQAGVQGWRMSVVRADGTTREIAHHAVQAPLAPTQTVHSVRADGTTVRLEIWAPQGVAPLLLTDVAQVALAALSSNTPQAVPDVVPPARVLTTAEEQQVLFRAIFDTSQEAIGVSKSGVHTMVNPAYLALFGYTSSSELLGKPILPLIAPEAQARVLEYVRKRASGAYAPPGYETRGLRRDGTAFDMEVNVSAYEFANEVYTLVILRDVTARKAAEGSRQESEAFYKAMFEINTAVKLLVDADQGVVVDANQAAAQFYGYALHELRGKRITSINTMAEDEVFQEMKAAREQRRAYFNFKHRLAGGDIRDVEVYSGPISVKGRSLLLSIIHDITWRKRLEEQLRQAQKMEAVGRLAGGIAHDFNNLLTALIGYGVMSLEDLQESHPARVNVEEMVKNAQRAEALTRQLLAFSRQQVLAPRVLNLNAVFVDMKLLLTRLIGEHIQLQTNLVPGRAMLRADRGQLEQVVMNLAVNARDAMPRGGCLTISTRFEDVEAPLPGLPSGRYVVLSVMDTGVGMDEQTRSRIFEPFFTTKPDGRGTGLGLATVYGIIQQSDGFIQVHSEKDRGTAFTLHFPRVEDSPEQAAPISRAAAPPLAAAPRTILVVEDNDDVRTFLCLSLRSAGHSIHAFGSGAEALAFATEHPAPIELLLTDVVMPGMSGPELFDALRTVRTDMHVLYISGYTDGLILEHGMREGGTAFLQKPFTGPVLLQKVAEILAQPRPADSQPPPVK